ncbi:MAG: UDP-N-acetylmuramoyl-L-alanine--D-glutamate ligase [Sphingobacteriales bacterium]|nr:MAG: UDP-N-acetylmuramoyl-L-alanine--D-glutamate ligase [Sphingobacteriales bacterium]
MTQPKLLILGAGESGVGAALLGRQQGWDVLVSDGGLLKDSFRKELQSNDIAFEEGGHSEQAFDGVSLVVKSPGIPGTVPAVQRLLQAGVPIVSEIEFAYRYKGNARIIAITGSNGKSTTTKLIYHLLRTGGLDASLTGNIGLSLARQIATHPTDWYVVEVSSFQLDDIETFRPHIAVVLNITPDHLDRYNYKIESYAAAKMRITEVQQPADYLVLNADDAGLKTAVTAMPVSKAQLLSFSLEQTCTDRVCACKEGSQLVVRTSGTSVTVPVRELALKGRHNESNCLAAATAALLAGVLPEAVVAGLRDFEGLPHRLETVGMLSGITFINDSKATNVDSVWYALDSMTTPTILILGGQDKGNDYSQIRNLVAEKVKAIVCMGVDNAPIHAAFGDLSLPIVDTDSATAAVDTALSLAQSGDTVLLSPACASFDLFKNYEDRGTQFRNAVQQTILSQTTQPA